MCEQKMALKTWQRVRVFVLIFALFILTSCGSQQSSQPSRRDKPLPSVVIAPVVSKDVSAAVEYVGRSEASQRVDIRARVKGVLLKRPFKEGGNVKAADPLYLIDPAEFKVAQSAAKARVERAEATLEEATRQLERYAKLVKRDTVSVAAYDEAKAKDGEARADLAEAKAALEQTQLDLSYTRILSPISGRSGRSNADVGNLIGPDTGVLVTVLRLDPIDILFSVGERDYLNFQQAIKRGEVAEFTPRIRLANGEIYPHDGDIDFVNNEVNPATGTITVRAKFSNPGGMLVPGQFVNVILKSTVPQNQIVIPQAAIQENQAGPFVLVVNPSQRVEMRPIKTGQRLGPEIVIKQGVAPGESIIVEGIQKVRPGAEVNAVPQTTTPRINTPQVSTPVPSKPKPTTPATK